MYLSNRNVTLGIESFLILDNVYSPRDLLLWAFRRGFVPFAQCWAPVT